MNKDNLVDVSGSTRINRRHFLQQTLLATAGLGLLGTASAVADGHGAHKLPEAIQTDLTKSDLIYLSPVQSNGSPSRCQAEVWFQELGGALYVVTDKNAWRAKAVAQGLTNTQLWVGDEGQWQSSKGKYLKLPRIHATAALEADSAVHAAVLEQMGDKYRMSWLVWGPRFKNGLADGSRVMLRYRPTAVG